MTIPYRGDVRMDTERAAAKMTDDARIAQRLRDGVSDGWSGDALAVDADTATEAADEIDRLQDEVHDLESALTAMKAERDCAHEAGAVWMRERAKAAGRKISARELGIATELFKQPGEGKHHHACNVADEIADDIAALPTVPEPEKETTT